MPPESTLIEFPFKGLNEGWAYGRQPEGTTPDAQNVVPFDTLQKRLRGGQRWGLSKYYSALHNGATALQSITSLAEATTGASVTETFTQANGVLDTTDWYLMEMVTYPNWTASVAYPYVTSNAVLHNNTTAAGVSYRVGGLRKDVFIEDANYELTALVTMVRHGGVGTSVLAGFIVRSAFPTFPMDITASQLQAYVSFSQTTVTCSIAGTTTGFAIGSSGDWKDPAYWTGGRTLKLVVTGDLFQLYADDVQIHNDVTNAALKGNLYAGFLVKKGTPVNDSVTLDTLTFSSTASLTSRKYRIVATSGGDIFTGTPGGSLQATVGGTNALATTGRVGAQPAFGLIYFCDGVNANYSILTNSTNTVGAWTPSGGALPVSGTTGARYIALYRGRIVMSGLATDPHNWFMSAAGDPLDWDYGATVSATMAVAGNNTDAGKCPDIVTCIAPYSDDMMYIGGDHTLWLMRGDPADRGRIDNVSYQTGISGPDAFTFDPNGVFYFFGAGTLWRMATGGIPEPLSRNRLDETLGAIDLTTNAIHLAWDNVRHGLFIFVVPSASGATTHYYWDQRTDSFWPIAFPNNHGPAVAYAFDGDDPDDQALILGGWDGYLRKIDPTTKTDDSTTISSYVKFPPMTGGQNNLKVSRVVATLDTSSAAAVLEMYTGEVPQAAINSSTIRFARSLAPGAEGGRTNILHRVTANSIVFKLSNSVANTTWAMENIGVMAAPAGRTRHGDL